MKQVIFRLKKLNVFMSSLCFCASGFMFMIIRFVMLELFNAYGHIGFEKSTRFSLNEHGNEQN